MRKNEAEKRIKFWWNGLLGYTKRIGKQKLNRNPSRKKYASEDWFKIEKCTNKYGALATVRSYSSKFPSLQVNTAQTCR